MNNGLLKSEILVKMVLEADIESKEEYSEMLLNYLSNSILTNMTEEFEDSISNLKYKMEAMSEALDIYNNTIAMNSYFFGVIKTIIEVSGKISNEKKIMKDILKIEKTDHGMSILNSLYKLKTLNHGTLAKKMNISSHSLTNFMKRMEGTNLWSRSRYGKYINYDITPIGEKCYQYIIMSSKNQIKTDKHRHHLSYINNLIEVIIEEVTSETPNINRITHEAVRENDKLSELDERFLHINISKSIRHKNNKFASIIECSTNNIEFETIYEQRIDFGDVFGTSCYVSDENPRKNHLLEFLGR